MSTLVSKKFKITRRIGRLQHKLDSEIEIRTRLDQAKDYFRQYETVPMRCHT